MLSGHPELGFDAAGYQELARRLEECLETREDAGATWQMYRRLLTLWCTHKPAVRGVGVGDWVRAFCTSAAATCAAYPGAASDPKTPQHAVVML